MINRFSRFLIKRPFVIISFWIICIIIFSFYAKDIGDKLSGDLSPPKGSETRQVQQIIKDEFSELDTEQLIITVSSNANEIGDKAFDSELDRLISEVEKHDKVTKLQSYRDEGYEELGSLGDSSGIIILGLNSLTLEESQEVVTELRDKITEQDLSLDINVTGLPAIANDLSSESEKDVGRSGKIALPFTLILLVIAFGSIIAAFIPPLVGWISLVVSLGVLALMSDLITIHALAQTVVAMLGLAAGIDYTLLMVTRFREEVNQRKTIENAILITVKTAGKTVVFSGMIVVLSLTALFFPPLQIIRSIGIAGIVVIVFTMLTATTLVPALLKVFGKFLVKSKPRPKAEKKDTIWTRWGKFSVEHSKILFPLSAVLLIVLAIPIFSMKIHNDGVDNLADTVESRKGVAILEEKDLAGTLDRIDILIDTKEPISEEIYQLTEELEKLEASIVLSPTPTQVELAKLQSLYEQGDKTYIPVQLISDKEERVLLRVMPKDKLNAENNEQFINDVTEVVDNHIANSVMYGGDPIAFVEFDEALFNDFPIAIAFVLLLTFILLAIVFRSLYMAAVAIVSNVLVLGASFGVLVYYFQEHLEVTALHPMVPIIVFAIIFGLSMDYQVFLLSRIKEERLQGASVKQSIVNGMTYTSRIITYAGLIMSVVFVAFFLSDVMTVKMLGFGLAVAIILDITIARLILMPALLSFQRKSSS